MQQMKTYMARTGEVEQKWWLVDASDKVVGRLAGDLAMVLMGKNRPTYTPHVDNGDYVVVINAAKAVLTGNKWQKKYAGHTGHPASTPRRPASGWPAGRSISSARPSAACCPRTGRPSRPSPSRKSTPAASIRTRCSYRNSRNLARNDTLVLGLGLRSWH